MNELMIESPLATSKLSDLRRVPLAELATDLDVDMVVARVVSEASRPSRSSVVSFNSCI
jgi:hypothetical protein